MTFDEQTTTTPQRGLAAAERVRRGGDIVTSGPLKAVDSVGVRRTLPHMEHSVSVTELPFNAFLGLQAAADPDTLLQLPAGGQYLNHLGTVHASALLALAEASSGEFLLRHFGSSRGVVPVVRHLEAKFRKPANGAVAAKAAVPAEALAQMDKDLAGKGRALVSVSVDLHDEAGTHALSAKVEWFIQRLAQGT